MMGKHYTCSACNFDFASGWSHHAGGQFIACSKCGAQFVLGNGESQWGAKDNETLSLRRLLTDEHIDTAVVVKNATIADDEEWDGVSFLQFNEFTCPDCNAAGIVQAFDDDSLCPACKNGRINQGGSCIY